MDFSADDFADVPAFNEQERKYTLNFSDLDEGTVYQITASKYKQTKFGKKQILTIMDKEGHADDYYAPASFFPYSKSLNLTVPMKILYQGKQEDGDKKKHVYKLKKASPKVDEKGLIV